MEATMSRTERLVVTLGIVGVTISALWFLWWVMSGGLA
jgi:hypothetical protein